MSRDALDEVESYLRKHRTPGIFDRLCAGAIQAAALPIAKAPSQGGKRTADAYVYDAKVFTKLGVDAFVVGRIMEETDQLLHGVNEEVAQSKETLKDLANEVRALSGIVQPALLDQIKELRSSRMTMVQEIRDSLGALREIRKFFLDSDYELEMARLERFVRVCRDIHELKQSGVFDAVCDSAIRLAIKET